VDNVPQGCGHNEPRLQACTKVGPQPWLARIRTVERAAVRRYCTMIVPFISGWIEQWYVMVPAVFEGEAERGATVHVAAVEFAVVTTSRWANPSLFVQVTASPTLIVTEVGSIAMFFRDT